MQHIRQSEPVQLTHQTRDTNETLSSNHRSRAERSYESNSNSKRRDAYISDIVNIQSLLNIPAMERKRHSTISSKERITINVCGDRYETHRTTLELYPDTLLGNRKQRKYYYDKTRNEYFFDRNRACFEAILYYYQSHGRLRRPNYVPIDIFLEEIAFFQLGQEALNQLRKDENIKEVKKIRLPKNRLRRYLWATMEYPNYSTTAKIVNIVSLLMILISTASLAVESLPQYTNDDQIICEVAQDGLNSSFINRSNYTNGTGDDPSDGIGTCPSYVTSPFFLIQTVTVACFTIELLLRIISTPSLLDFIKNLMNWIDIIAIVPYFVLLAIRFVDQQNGINTTTYVGLRFLRIIRFARVFKFYRVFRGIKSFRVLASTLKQSLPDFLLMICILTLLSSLFGAAAYFAENDTNGVAFDSILKATYWGVITITGVGYGDITPITPIGRVIACLCGLSGAATVGMLVSVLVDRYQRVYARKLYVKEEAIDFLDHSDDENNDADSRSDLNQFRRLSMIQDIPDPDARAKINATLKKDDTSINNTTNPFPPLNIPVEVENHNSPTNNGVHFIIGFVDDKNHETSCDLLETISSVVARRRIAGDNIQLNMIPDDKQRSSPYDVRFDLTVPSEEESDEDTDGLTEIVYGSGRKGNVLKKFQYPSSPKNLLDKPERQV